MKIIKEEEKYKKIDENLKKLPIIGKINKNGTITMPASEREDDDDFWTEMYIKNYGEI